MTNNQNNAKNQIKELAELISAAHGTREIDGHQFALVPEGYRVQSLEKYQMHPQRKQGLVSLGDSESFIRFVTEEKTSTTRLYGKTKGEFRAVFDDNSTDTANWRDYRAEVKLEHSMQWNTWIRNNKQGMKQHEFAQFIEDNLPDIVEPVSAVILEVSRSLQAKKKVSFESGIRLSNGETQFTYSEEIQGSSAKGLIQIPESFWLGIPVFQNGTGYKIEARLRYRISEGGLVMWYDLLRPEKFHEDATKDIWKEIEEKTGLKIFLEP